MGLMDRAKKAWAEKQDQWAKDAEKEEAEKAKKQNSVLILKTC